MEIFYNEKISKEGVDIKGLEFNNINLKFIQKFNECIKNQFHFLEMLQISNIGDFIYSTDSLNFYPIFSDYQLNRFSKIEYSHIIRSKTSFSYQFTKRIIDSNWDLLLLVSDRGLDIKPYLDHMGINKKAIIILADIREAETFTSNSNIIVHRLPYYDHNNHVKLFFNDKRAVDAFYYYKRGFSNNINAIHFDLENHTDNINMLMQKFLGYYVKAVSYNTSKRYIPHFENFKDLLKDFSDVQIMDEHKEVHSKFIDIIRYVFQKEIKEWDIHFGKI